MFGFFRKPSPPSEPTSPAQLRKHHYHFTHAFIPQGASGEQAGAFIPAMITAAQRQAVGDLWTKFGAEIVPASELVPPVGLEAHIFRLASHVACLFIFPQALQPDESVAALLLAGPLQAWPENPATKIPFRYFVLDRVTDQETRIREWSPEGYRTWGSGPAQDAVIEFSDVVLHRICGFPEEKE